LGFDRTGLGSGVRKRKGIVSKLAPSWHSPIPVANRLQRRREPALVGCGEKQGSFLRPQTSRQSLTTCICFTLRGQRITTGYRDLCQSRNKEGCEGIFLLHVQVGVMRTSTCNKKYGTTNLSNQVEYMYIYLYRLSSC